MPTTLPDERTSAPLQTACDMTVADTTNLDLISLLLNRAQNGPAAMWEEVVRTHALGYGGMLANFWNLLVAAPHLIDDAVAILTDEGLIHRSQVRPTEFLPVIHSLQRDPPHGALRALGAISEAVDLSLAHEPTLSGRTLVALDLSNAMTQRAIRLGAFATAVMAKTSLTEVALVGESMVRPTLDRRESTLGLARSIERLSGSGGASRKGMFQGIADMYQRVIILGTSDVGFAAAFDSWRGRSRQKTAVFSVDLHSSNGKVRTVQDGLHLLSGWTSTSLDVIHQLEST